MIKKQNLFSIKRKKKIVSKLIYFSKKLFFLPIKEKNESK
jgi:hypothetical protein